MPLHTARLFQSASSSYDRPVAARFPRCETRLLCLDKGDKSCHLSDADNGPTPRISAALVIMGIHLLANTVLPRVITYGISEANIDIIGFRQTLPGQRINQSCCGLRSRVVLFYYQKAGHFVHVALIARPIYSLLDFIHRLNNEHSWCLYWILFNRFNTSVL